MNKNVLRTMIILCWVFLALYAVLKLVPQLASKFVIVVNNEKIVKVGSLLIAVCGCNKWFILFSLYLHIIYIYVRVVRYGTYHSNNI